jgi:endoglycosylceramidase
MKALGLDLLRLPINWSGIEPERDVLDDAYLARVDDAIACAAAAGVLVLVDLHQDAYSKEIGEDGAPLWAIVPPPDELLEGPLDDLGSRRTSVQVMRSFDHFFAAGDPDGLQAEFMDMLEVVARRWADEPAVIGFELFNEPTVGEDEVDEFHYVAAARVRAAAPGKLVMFEPSAIRNLFDFVPEARDPFPVTGAVYAPHVYTYVFQPDPTQLEELEPEQLEPSVRGTRAEATAWGTPLLIGEYGIGPTAPNADLWMGVQAELHDAYLASDAFWVWKEQSQANWGVYDWDAATNTWTERPQVVAWLSRVHAARIAGEVIANAYDHTTRALRLEVRGAGATPHLIYVPDGAHAIACDGAPRDGGTGWVEVVCDGVLTVAP